MPTIIESLIVELGLDPSGFNESEQKAVESLQRIETTAQRSGAAVDDFGSDVLGFLRVLENPARGIRRHLESIAAPARSAQRSLGDVAAQARRTGTEGEAGALAVTSGIRALAIAGLAATAVFAALGKVIESAVDSAHQTFNVGVGAAAAGLPVQEFSAISQALFTHGNVPEQETQDWLAGIKQFQENWRLRGDVDKTKVQNLARLGITDALHMTAEQMMQQLAVLFSGEDRATAISQGASVGLSRTQSLALRSAGANLPAEIAEARTTAVTSRDTKAAGDLLNASNQLEVTYGKLYRTIMTDLDPTLIQYIRDLNSFGVTLTSVMNNYQPFIVWLGKLIKLFADMTPAALLLPGAIGRIWKDIKAVSEGPVATPATGGSAAPGAPAATPEHLPEQLVPAGGSYLEDIAAAEGTLSRRGVNYDAVYGNGKYAQPPKPLTQMTLAEVEQFGSVLGKATGSLNTSAVGGFQIEARTTLPEAAAALGYDPNTTKFTPEVQRRLAAWIAEHQGLSAWQGFETHPNLRAAAAGDLASRRAAIASAAPAPPGAATPAPPPIGATGTGGDAAGTGDTATGYGPRGPLGQTTAYDNGNQDFAGGTPGPGSPWAVRPAAQATLSGARQSMLVMPPGVAALLAGARQGAMASNGTAAAGPTTNSNDNSTTATFGPINVHTAATSPQGIGTAVSDSVNRNLLVAQSNRGLT